MILLLAGTAEARALAERLAAAGVPAVASLAGVTATPAALPVPTRSGGFGGSEGFLRALRAMGITAVIDATHPFASRITQRTARLCHEHDIPFLRLERPGWRAGPADRWSRVPDLAAAAAAIPRGARAFLATGRQSLPAFAGVEATLFLRVIDPPAALFPHRGDWIVGRPPFDAADEAALFARLAVDCLIVKDAGGTEGRAKLDAARDLGLPVILVDRPKGPEGAKVENIEDAMSWIAQLG